MLTLSLKLVQIYDKQKLFLGFALLAVQKGKVNEIIHQIGYSGENIFLSFIFE